MNAEILPDLDGRISGRRWMDGHDDKIEAGVQTDPVPWQVDDDEDELFATDVVHVTGDAYLEPEQAKELAAVLVDLADQVDTLRAARAEARA